MYCTTLIFSRDRALQLDATLRSFLLHCQDAASSEVRILFTTTAPLHEEQYRQLEKEYQGYSFLQFIPEQSFYSDTIALLAPYDYVLFLVDDNIFVRDFRLSEAIENLQKNPDALGFSLRLGKNTTYCYPLDKAQKLPDFQLTGKGIQKYNWTTAEYDFGYPLEVSSSVYRVENILPFIAQLPFRNPNTLEALMAANKSAFQQEKPFLFCYEQSVTFCAPINIVQTDWLNRSSGKIEYTTDNLAKLFEEGYRIDVASYSGFVPNACHQEVELKFIEPEKPVREKQPLVSIIIPCYNQAHYLSEAVESVVAQTYQNWECIIVNDGSPDNTSEVARKLIAKYPDKGIVLLEKENGGLADARNFGIKSSKGKYILPLDADDVILPDMLQKTVALLEANPNIAIAYTDVIHFGVRDEVHCAGEYNFEYLRYQNHINYCSLYRKRAWESTGGYNTNMVLGYEDWDFWITCGEKGFYGKRIPEPLFKYRVKENSMWTKAVEYDDKLRAQIVFNHPGIYTREDITWAEKILERSLIKEIPQQSIIEGKKRFLGFSGMASFHHFHLGCIYTMKCKFDEALNEYQKAISLGGPPVRDVIIPIHYTMGSIYEKQGSLEKAKERFEEIIKYGKDIPFSVNKNKFLGGAHFHLGCIYQAIGEREKAKREFEECLKFIPEHRKARENLRILIDAGLVWSI